MKIQTLVYARRLVMLAFISIAIWLAFWHHTDRGPIPYIGFLVCFALSITNWVLTIVIRERQPKSD